MAKFNKHGIPIVGLRDRLPWAEEAGTVRQEEENAKQDSLFVRGLVVGKTAYKNRVLLVYRMRDLKRSRRPGWGMPGVRIRVEKGETEPDALKRMFEQIPWPILGHVQIHSRERKLGDRTERELVFLVTVDEENLGKIDAEAAREISEAHFFSIDEIVRLQEVDMRPRAMAQEMRSRERGIYVKHVELLAESLVVYMKIKGLSVETRND